MDTYTSKDLRANNVSRGRQYCARSAGNVAKWSREVLELDKPGLALTTRSKLLHLGGRVNTHPAALRVARRIKENVHQCQALHRHARRGVYH